MSLNFIHDFQMKIFQLLSADEEICSKIDKIYLSVVQDAKYPFLLINILRIENISKFSQSIYEVGFEICAFARDRNHNILVSLADKISTKLEEQFPHFNDYTIAGLKAYEVSFGRSSDLITNKLTMQYKALLKKGINI